MKKVFDYVPIIVVIIAMVVITTIQTKEDYEQQKIIDSLVRTNEIVINYDSIQSEIESNIYDSLSKSIISLEGDIEKLRVQNYLLRKSNEELEKKYRSIIVDLPEL